MIQILAGAAGPEVLERAARALAAGGLLIFPTDTLYALGGPVFDPRVSGRVRAAKGRDEGKPLPLVAADVVQARTLVRDWCPLADRLAGRFWPGPLSLVLRAAPAVPEDVTAGTGNVAVRVPGLELTRQLCRRLGPLVSTSANRSGEQPPETCAAAVAAFPDLAGLALDVGPGGPSPSTIVDVTASPARLLRKGSIDWSEVEAVVEAAES